MITTFLGSLISPRSPLAAVPNKLSLYFRKLSSSASAVKISATVLAADEGIGGGADVGDGGTPDEATGELAVAVGFLGFSGGVGEVEANDDIIDRVSLGLFVC